MSNASSMYALSIEQCTKAIQIGGNLRSVLVQGDMGSGKSSILKLLAANLPTHKPCYFDCTTKDLADVTVPKLIMGTPESTAEQGYVTYLTNEELGMHLSGPVILMIDEYGKAVPSVKNALTRPVLERKLGSYTLHPDSIIFLTTNLGAEGVGDILKAHHRNRITVVTMRKSTNMEWIEWGLNNGIDPVVLGAAREFPQFFHSFTDYKDPEENPYIFHPKSTRASFVTPRSLEAASDWMKLRANFDNTTLTALLMGTLGERAAMDMMAYVSLADQMPSLDSIKSDPKSAKVPTSAAGVCLVVFRTLGAIEAPWVDAWMTYLDRLDTEAQGMFANGVRAANFNAKRKAVVMTNKKFTEWALKNNYLFAADKV